MKKVMQIVPTLLLLLAMTAPALAVEATGMGVDRDHAIRAALQSAVEMQVGVYVKENTIVEDAMLVKDEIVSHADGYVAGYKVIKEESADGMVEVTVDAQVRETLIGDRYAIMETLQQMARHPRVLVFAVADGIEAVPAGGEFLDSTVNTVAQVFGDEFKFDVLDWSTMRAKFPQIQGTLNREKALKFKDLLKADYFLTVGVDLPQRKSAVMHLEMVNASDNEKLAAAETPVEMPGFPANDVELWKLAAKEASVLVYDQSVSLAKATVDDFQKRFLSGGGERYTLMFKDFPDVQADTDFLETMPGYVRHDVKKAKKTYLELAYWSNMSNVELLKTVEEELHKKGFKVKAMLDGRVLRFKWVNPDGF